METYLLRRAMGRSIVAFTGLRLSTTTIMLVTSLTMPGRLRSVYPIVESTAKSLEQNDISLLFLAPWYRFDTIHYLEIAQGGYSNPILTTWAPLYPILIRGLGMAGLSPMLAALLISSIACWLAFFLIYLLVHQIGGVKLADRTLLALVIFPSSFFLVAGYTESLFVLLSTACILLLYRQSWFWAGIIGSLATLTRYNGAALALPALWALWQSLNRVPHSSWVKHLISLKSPFWAVLLPPFTFIGWNCWVHFGMDYPWPMETLSSNWKQHTGFPWEGIIGNMTSLLGFRVIDPNPISPVAQIYDLFLVILAITLLIAIARKTQIFPIILQCFTWVNILVILVKVDNNWLLVSASRYLLSAFPIFIAIAMVFTRKWIWVIWILLSFVSQVFLLICFYNWIWVA